MLKLNPGGYLRPVPKGENGESEVGLQAIPNRGSKAPRPNLVHLLPRAFVCFPFVCFFGSGSPFMIARISLSDFPCFKSA